MQHVAPGAAPFLREWLARKDNAIEAAYRSFAHAAELEDQGELAPAAAWQTLGKVTCALISAEHEERIRAATYLFRREFGEGDALAPIGEGCRHIAFEMDQSLDRVSRELGLLADAAARGGSLSTDTVRWFANALFNEFNELRDQLRRLYALSLQDAPGTKATESAAGV